MTESELRSAFSDRAFTLFHERMKTFGTRIGALYAFIIGFSLLVLLPFSSIAAAKRDTDARLASVTNDLANADSVAAPYDSALAAMEQFEHEISSGSSELRAFVMQMNGLVEPPDGDSTVATTLRLCQGDRECAIKHRIATTFVRYNSLFNTTVLPRVTTVRGNGVAGLTPVDTAMDRLRLRLGKLIDSPSQPVTHEWWRTGEGKDSFWVDLGRGIDSVWQGSGVPRERDRLRDQVVHIRSSRNHLLDERRRLKQEEVILANRVADMKSPAGAIPASLDDSIRLFPVLIAIGFALCVAPLTNAATLRRVLQARYRELDPQGQTFSARNVSLIAPLWVDHLGPKRSAIVQALVLALPILPFVCGFRIATRPTDSLGRAIYTALYFVAAVTIILSYWFLFRSILSRRSQVE